MLCKIVEYEAMLDVFSSCFILELNWLCDHGYGGQFDINCPSAHVCSCISRCTPAAAQEAASAHGAIMSTIHSMTHCSTSCGPIAHPSDRSSSLGQLVDYEIPGDLVKYFVIVLFPRPRDTHSHIRPPIPLSLPQVLRKIAEYEAVGWPGMFPTFTLCRN